MTTLRFGVAAVVCLLASAHSAAAAPLTLTLQQTSVLYNLDPPAGAPPSPFAITQYDAGDILISGQKIGEYLRTKDLKGGTVNAAALTITLFFPGTTDVPSVITLEGAHSFNSGGEKGSISASDIGGVVGIGFTASTAAGTLTLLFP
jgi:hypothetical protein